MFLRSAADSEKVSVFYLIKFIAHSVIWRPKEEKKNQSASITVQCVCNGLKTDTQSTS